MMENKTPIQTEELPEPPSSPKVDVSKVMANYNAMRLRLEVAGHVEGYDLSKLRKAAAEVISAAGQTEALVEARKAVASEGVVGPAAAANPKIVEIVAEDTRVQSEIFSGDASLYPRNTRDEVKLVMAETYKPRGEANLSLLERTGDSLLKKETTPDGLIVSDGGIAQPIESKFVLVPEKLDIDLNPTEDELRRNSPILSGAPIFETLTPTNTSPKSEVTVNNFTAEEQLAAKEKWLKEHPEAAARDAEKKALKEASEVTINNFTEDEQLAAKEKWVRENAGVQINNFTEAEQQAAKEKWMRENPEVAARDAEKKALREASERAREELKKMTLESQGPVEGVAEALTARQEKSKGALERMGLPVAKGLEVYGKLPKGLRTSLGFVLAGASVVSGLYLGGAVAMTGFLAANSAISFASRFYEKGIAEAEKEAGGGDIEKGKIALKSVGWGMLVTLGTGLAFSALGPVLGEAGEKIAAFFHGTDPAQHVASVPLAHVEVPLPHSPDIITIGENYHGLPEYTIVDTDNFTNIIKANVLPQIPGAENLTSFQQNNMIENLVAAANAAKEAGNDTLFQEITKFTNLDLIHPGETLDLENLRKLLSETKFDNFGGETLLKHAKSFRQ